MLHNAQLKTPPEVKSLKDRANMDTKFKLDTVEF